MSIRLIAVLLAFVACAPAAATTQQPRPVVVEADALGGISREEYAARRAALARLVGDGVVVAFGSVEPAADYLEFHQNSNFRYLTGIIEKDAVMIMPVRGGVGTPTLFVHERDPDVEVWSGSRLGPEQAAAISGMDSRGLRGFDRVADSIVSGAGPVYLVSGGDAPAVFVTHDEQFAQRLTSRGITVRSGAQLVAQLRGRKSQAELALIRRAVDITVDAHRAAARAVAPGRYEFEVEAALEHVFRASGAERPAFASIVGSGANSTVLHYLRNDAQMREGDLIVVDIGAAWRGYAGDVTRTYPVNGRFTADQRAVYRIVRDAQAAAERAALPGASALDMVRAAERTVAEGLVRLGLIESADATYDCAAGECRQFRLYYMHGLGHAIGLDVHDPGTSGVQPGRLEPGDVFSIEPGIYVRRNLVEIISDTPRNRALKARIAANVARYADIGVRIEDDYIVTATGLEWISRAPREAGEVERAVGATGR